MNVFVCRPKPDAKVQLEIPRHTLDQFVKLAGERGIPAKQMMESVLEIYANKKAYNNKFGHEDDAP